MISAGVYIVDLIKNSHLIIDSFKNIMVDLRNANIKIGLANLMNLFIKLTPLIILGFTVLKSIL